MKKQLFTLFLMGIMPVHYSFSVNQKHYDEGITQPNLLLIEDNKQWSSVTYKAILPQETKTDILYTNADTLINDSRYLKLYHTYFENLTQSSYVGAIRQLEDRVYYIEENEEKEELLYDFNLNVGDEIEVRGSSSFVKEIKYEEFEGITRKVFRFDEDFESSEWIEGIGSKNSLLNSNHWDIAGSTTQLLCCQKEGETLYKEKNQNTCFIQEPYSYYLAEGTKWIDVNYEWTVTEDIEKIYQHTYELKGDTIINGKVFWKLFHNNLLIGGIHETINKKIYLHCFFDSNDHINRIMPDFISEGPIEKNKTYLLYSFSNWEIGETIEYLSIYGFVEQEKAEGTEGLYYTKMPITKMEYITLRDGNQYKILQGMIESIGSTQGVFSNLYDHPTSIGYRTALYQYYRNGELLYEDETLSSIEEIKKQDITIQQSYSGEVTFILENPSDYEQIQLFDINGVNIQSYIINGKNEIQIENLSQGIYLYKILSTNGKNNEYGKFIISH